MITESLIRKLAEEKTAGTEIFLLDVMIRKGNRILVTIDGDQGVKIEDCVGISRHIEGQLDRDKEDFELQVSSGGADQPLKLLRQYKQHIGRTLKVQLNDKTEKTGILSAINPDSIELNILPVKVKGKKNVMEEPHNEIIPFSEIEESTIVLTF
ncbi:MAG: ribosome assembly cofactor RimP [Bacteroidales bacterium]